MALAQATPPPPPVQPTDTAPAPATKGRSEGVQKPDDQKRPEGWSPGIAFGGTFNLIDSRSVVGTQDGTTLTLGLALDASLEFNHGKHEWRNALKAGAGATRTPSLDEFVKTADGLSFESIYLFHALEIFGPYARASLTTPMFQTLDIRPAAVTYDVANIDGTTSQFIGRRFALTDPFDPLVLRQGIGAFVQPVNTDQIKFEAKAGVGAQESVASGYALTDDSATPNIEVTELDNSFAVGAEVVANAWGFFDTTKRVSYSVGAGVLFPFVTSSLPEGDDRSLIELASFEGNVGLNVKLFDWATLGYKLNVTRDPLVVDEWQVSNNLLVTIGAAFGTKAPAPPPKCDCTKECAAQTPPPATAPATETKPAETKPAETKPAETKPAETKPAEKPPQVTPATPEP